MQCFIFSLYLSLFDFSHKNFVLFDRSELLLDQYRKKAELYSTRVVLAPLGDDFRYDTSKEWDVQYTNYQKMFDYLNSNPSLNVEVSYRISKVLKLIFFYTNIVK